MTFLADLFVSTSRWLEGIFIILWNLGFGAYTCNPTSLAMNKWKTNYFNMNFHSSSFFFLLCGSKCVSLYNIRPFNIGYLMVITKFRCCQKYCFYNVGYLSKNSVNLDVLPIFTSSKRAGTKVEIIVLGRRDSLSLEVLGFMQLLFNSNGSFLIFQTLYLMERHWEQRMTLQWFDGLFVLWGQGVGQLAHHYIAIPCMTFTSLWHMVILAERLMHVNRNIDRKPKNINPHYLY